MENYHVIKLLTHNTTSVLPAFFYFSFLIKILVTIISY